MAATDAAPAPFPDCWTAYGATNRELDAYGSAPRLTVGAAWAVLLAQLGLLILLAGVVASQAPLPLRAVAAAAGFAVLGSALFGGLRLVATARALVPGREHLWLARALGPSEAVAWEQIGQIALAETPTRRAVGLRLRPEAASRLPATLREVHRRVCSDFDFLLFPADGDCELLGRVLLRYCIDREARRRLPGEAG